jgi:hypothetical protein
MGLTAQNAPSEEDLAAHPVNATARAVFDRGAFGMIWQAGEHVGKPGPV